MTPLRTSPLSSHRVLRALNNPLRDPLLPNFYSTTYLSKLCDVLQICDPVIVLLQSYALIFSLLEAFPQISYADFQSSQLARRAEKTVMDKSLGDSPGFADVNEELRSRSPLFFLFGTSAPAAQPLLNRTLPQRSTLSDTVSCR
jgi:hypothetical protein